MLTREYFQSFFSDIASDYNYVVTYGTSLGGYASLYYGSSLKGAYPLCSAPRLPLHPSNKDAPEWKPNSNWDEFEYLHKPLHSVEVLSNRSTILLGKDNETDLNFFTNHIFPNQNLDLSVFYLKDGGHEPLAKLLKKGTLKSFINSFTDQVSGYDLGF